MNLEAKELSTQVHPEQGHGALPINDHLVSSTANFRIKKRSGSLDRFDIDKVVGTLRRVCKGLEDKISINLISKEFVKNIYDQANSEDVEKALILSTVPFIEKHPAYNKVAARLLMQKIYKEVMKRSVNEQNLETEYRKSFIAGIQNGVEIGSIASKLLEFDLEKLAAGINVKRDQDFNYIGLQTLYEKYLIKNEGQRVELPQAFWMRVAMGLAIREEEKEARALEFYENLSSMRFISSTPTLLHSGLTHPQLSSCYLTTVEDDLHDIFKCIGDNAQLSKWSGGVANDWSNIRATGSLIKSVKIGSQGLVPFLKIANDVTVAISRSGSRRGATVAYLETWHFEIEDFLDLRRNTGDERRRTHDMNTANWVPDLFMKRVEKDQEWTLFSPNDVPELHHIYGKEFERKYEEYERAADAGEIKQFRRVNAVALWRKMLSRLFETGHPWITFKDPCNVRSPQDHVGVVHSSNLCTEITLNTSQQEVAVCNLGSINLEKHVIDGKVDFEKLKATVHCAIRMLDNVVDINFYPTKEAKHSNLKHRPVGLGVMAFQDALYKLDVNFESPKALELADNMQEFISYHAILASSTLAKERGSYETYKGSKWDRGIFPLDTIALLEEQRSEVIAVSRSGRLDWKVVKEHVAKHGMRNSNTMAIAPTATISNIAGCFPCIEPIYKNIYVKANMSGEFTVVNRYLVQDLEKLGLWSNDMLDEIKFNDGSLQSIDKIPVKLKEKYKEAFEIDPLWLIKITAARGKWIDQSQSHNIFIKGVSGTLLHNTYMAAWKAGLKTTYYLRTLGASQIEKATLDAKKYGFTQKRDFGEGNGSYNDKSDLSSEVSVKIKPKEDIALKVCSIEDPDCESCQ